MMNDYFYSAEIYNDGVIIAGVSGIVTESSPRNAYAESCRLVKSMANENAVSFTSINIIQFNNVD
ncbi:MAG: hypothetical protein ACRDC5_06090 [Vibrio sp.]